MTLRTTLATAFVAAIVLAATAYADLGDPLFKLLPDDGDVADRFGIAVAISGGMAIVGAREDHDNGDNSGSAYLFDVATGQQLAKILPNDGAVGDKFGYPVAISGTTAIVGAMYNDDLGTSSGSAYLFDTQTGQQLAKLLPDDGAAVDVFGRSVGISGSTAIVGASGDDDNGLSSGSAYLFDATTGRQIFKLLPNDGAAGDFFGTSAAISGDIAIVGAERDDDNGSNSGSAYLFDTTTGQQIFKLLPEDAGANDRFGWSVAISGSTAIVGAYQDGDNGFSSGSAYLFDSTTGQQIAKLLPEDGDASDRFGWSVSISDTTAIVGTGYDDDNGLNSGSAYLFDATTGSQITKLLPDDGAMDDNFGSAVAISGSTGIEFAVVGARHDDDNGFNSGSAYVFRSPPCPGDFDFDGDVSASDLAQLLAAWGPSPGHPADLDGDGEVGPLDLALILGNWGPCP